MRLLRAQVQNPRTREVPTASAQTLLGICIRHGIAVDKHYYFARAIGAYKLSRMLSGYAGSLLWVSGHEKIAPKKRKIKERQYKKKVGN